MEGRLQEGVRQREKERERERERARERGIKVDECCWDMTPRTKNESRAG